MPASARQVLGNRGQGLAKKYFIDRGYTLLGENVRLGHSEIDLIVRRGDTTVFVEVKTRSNDFFGTPEEAVTKQKIAAVARGIALYIRKHPRTPHVRFDVVAVFWPNRTATPTVRHYPAVGEGAALAFLE